MDDEKIRYYVDGRELVLLDPLDVELAILLLRDTSGPDSHLRRMDVIRQFRANGYFVAQAYNIVQCAWERLLRTKS